MGYENFKGNTSLRSNILAIAGGILGLFSVAISYSSNFIYYYIGLSGPGQGIHVGVRSVYNSIGSHPVLVVLILAGMCAVVAGSITVFRSKIWGARIFTTGALLTVLPLTIFFIEDVIISPTPSLLVLLSGVVFVNLSDVVNRAPPNPYFESRYLLVNWLVIFLSGNIFYFSALQVRRFAMLIEREMIGSTGIDLMIFEVLQVIRHISFLFLILAILFYVLYTLTSVHSGRDLIPIAS